MAVTDWIQTAAAIYFAWQQNRIFRQQNEIFAIQAGQTAVPDKTSQMPWIRKYWPTLIMVGLMALTGYDIYARHGSQLIVPWWFYVLLLLIAVIGELVVGRLPGRLIAGSAAKEPSSKLMSRRVVYDVVGECSMGEDQPGPWKYGYSQGVGNTFDLLKARHSDMFDGVDRWFSPQIADLGVMHNRTDYTVAGEPRTYTIPADMIHMHPGWGGYCAVIRWECPEDGVYTILGSCEGLDKQDGADPEVHIMRNSRDLWHTTLGGVPSVKTFSLRESFESTDTLDFAVSQGAQWGADSVGLKATIRKA